VGGCWGAGLVQGAVLRCAACAGWEMLRAGLRKGCARLGSRRCVLIARGRRRAGLRGAWAHLFL